MAVKTKRAAAAKTPAVRAADEKAAAKDAPAGKAAGKGAVDKPAGKAGARRVKQTLVIVESPAKAKTIEKYLGSSYTVKASMGHLIDLPRSRMAVDVEHGFEPEYITVRGRAGTLNELRRDAKKADAVLLASDNDREGEAIAWHLRNALSASMNAAAGKKAAPISRISFNEITPQAIKAAVAAPREIDDAKVNAQKARRVLDRLVGYSLSPLLWKKVKGGLSAGRVQSVALRLICEREREVEAFVPEEYWTLEGEFAKKGGKATFKAQLVAWHGQKPELKTEAAVNEVVAALSGKTAAVGEIREVEKTVRPRPPFTTSQLQQAAANRLGFTSKRTMQIAQRLYEGVSLGASRVGLITYMRTDSVRISESALADARAWIGANYPEALPEAAQHYSAGKNAQDAHEAIRPTYVKNTPAAIEKYLSREEFKVYSIIWERFVASQMKPARTKTVSIDIEVGNGDSAVFRLSGTRVVEKGFYAVLKLLATKDEKGTSVPPVKTGDALDARRYTPEQHFTQGPARYTDASIVKTLEEKGIGRPSTYAPTISVLLDRYYVTRQARQLVPTVLGRLINDMLVANFGGVVNADFTAEMERKLDGVADNSLRWQDMIGEFYGPFKTHVDEVGKTLENYKGTLDEPTGEVCEKCGRPMVKKLGRFGYFLACTGFPACRNARPLPLAKCPRCGGDIVARKTRGKGREFYGCNRYPECDFLTHFKPAPGETCPKCGAFLVEKYDKQRGTDRACGNPGCDYVREEAPPASPAAPGGEGS